ncbi:MAG TPA: START domain-containing protein [Steroidobacteraceae bacterium]|nr:START domain-containing protein [Steroidobacteraceae bacterium]
MTTLRIARLCLGFLVGCLPVTGHAGAWEGVTEKDGIVVSQRMVEGRPFPQLRAQGEVRGTPNEILAVLLDVPAYREWVPDCAEATILRRTGARRRLIYTRTDMPWPVLDREAVIDQEVYFVRASRLVKVEFRAVPAPEVPQAVDTIRTEFAEGSYTIEALDAGRSRVTYLIHADPGGAVPGWLVQLQIRRNPLETLMGLRRRLEEARAR